MFSDYSHIESTSFYDELLPYFDEMNLDEMGNRFVSHFSPREIYLSIGEESINDVDSESSNYNSNTSNISIKTNRKRGRQNGRIDSQHTIYKNDCRMAKIQIGYFTFLILLLNIIMKKMKIKYQFLQLSGRYKSNINQLFRASLNKKSIKEIIEEAPISQKYKKDIEHNIYVINKLKEEGHDIILDILEKNFLFFFVNIYFPNIKKFNLSSFKLKSFEVELPPKIKLFKDLLNNPKIDNLDRYKIDMEKCAKKYFFSKTQL